MRTILFSFTAFAAVLITTVAAAENRIADTAPQSSLVLQRSPVSGLAAIIVDNHVSVLSREAAVHSLGKDLERADIAPLLEFLAVRPDPNDRNIAGLRYLKNEVMTALRNQHTAPDGFTQTLIGIYRDRLQDEVVRDYVIQHLGAYPEIKSISKEDRKNIHEVLREALAENNDIAGTALIALHLLSRSGATTDANFVNSHSLSLVTVTGTPNSVRATAIQICAERGIKEAVPAIERYVATGPGLIQVASISALGELGSREDITVLNSVMSAQDHAVSSAVHKAIARIQSRIRNEQF